MTMVPVSDSAFGGKVTEGLTTAEGTLCGIRHHIRLIENDQLETLATVWKDTSSFAARLRSDTGHPPE
jgi:hypothetical protein